MAKVPPGSTSWTCLDPTLLWNFVEGGVGAGSYQRTQKTPVYASASGPSGSEPCSDLRFKPSRKVASEWVRLLIV